MTTSQGKKSSGSFLRRALSLLVVTTFITTNHFTAFSFAQTISAEKNRSAVQSANPMRLSDLNIPESIGKADEIFTGTSVQTVILIQDAHAIPDAQHSITRLIDHFQQNYGIDTVALEGASAGLDPEMFKTFPDQETLKKVFKGYHEKGELAGGVAAAIFNTRPGQYRGIEDWNIYQDGIRLYLEAMKRQPVIREKLLATTKELRKEKESSYPPKLLEVDRLMETFQANGANLLEVMEKLAEIKAPAPGSELALLVEESRKGSESDADLNIEVKRLADEVKRDLTALKPSAAGSQLTAFNKKYQEFQTSGITPEAFASFMKDLVVEFRLPVKVSEKLRGSVKRQQRMEDIQGTKLFEDFEKYADGVADSLMTDGKQREISRRSRELRLLERFNRLELTHEDWRQLQKMDPRSKIRDAGKKEKSPGNSYLVSNILNLASEFQDHFAFYKNAIRRDSVLFDNLRKLLTTDRESSGAVIAVAGGFHARGLTRLLKDADISYALLMPAIQTLPDQTTYRDQMEGKVSWKDSFKVENGKVSLYNAFVRGTRDRLLLMVPGTAGTGSGNPSRNVPGTVDENSVLKNWRDNIIRDMAGKNKITESGQYTRFIDELVKAADDRVPAADDIRTMLMAKVEKFIEIGRAHV